MSKIDLHIHSQFSDDGEFSIEEIIERCQLLHMELIAVTDHNSVRGVAEALRAAADIRVISGVELDCTCKGKNFHLLGYNFDHTFREFAEIEQDIREQELQAAEQKIHLFRRATGIPVSVSEILGFAGGGVVTGEMIGEYVLKQENLSRWEFLKPYLPGGAKSDMPYVHFYWDFFSPGKPAYVPIRYISLSDATALIHKTGGIAVLAHPGQNLHGDFALLDDIISEGIDGIEAFSSYHSAGDAAHFLEIARQNKLLATCGSDFHGKNKPDIQIGNHGATQSDPDIGLSILAQFEFIN